MTDPWKCASPNLLLSLSPLHPPSHTAYLQFTKDFPFTRPVILPLLFNTSDLQQEQQAAHAHVVVPDFVPAFPLTDSVAHSQPPQALILEHLKPLLH